MGAILGVWPVIHLLEVDGDSDFAVESRGPVVGGAEVDLRASQVRCRDCAIDEIRRKTTLAILLGDPGPAKLTGIVLLARGDLLGQERILEIAFGWQRLLRGSELN